MDARALGPLPRRGSAVLALALLVPAPSLPLLASAAGAPAPVPTLVAVLAWAWIAALPVLWHRRRDRLPVRISRPARGPVAFGLVAGAATFGLMVGVYLLAEPSLDLERARRTMRDAGLGSPVVFWALALYVPVVNALLEEYAWRWFAITRCAAALSIRAAPWVASALFTVHHALAYALHAEAGLAVALTLGTYGVSLFQSWLFVRHASVWPAYAHHVCVDLALVFVLHRLLHGGSG
jgi:membrane protease YdiL (CAAX protease family)